MPPTVENLPITHPEELPMFGWIIALIGVLLVVVNPMIGIGIFALGAIVAVGSTGSGKTSPEAKALSGIFGFVFGGIIVLLGASAAVGIVGALLF